MNYPKSSTTTALMPLGILSRTDHVENILREYFEKNKFRPGDALPNEIEIAQKLNVSRNVVREALSRLRMLGMVETRPRRGMIMTRPNLLAGIEKVLNPLILSKDDLKDIFEMRLILEMGIAEYLFARKTKKDINELESIVASQKDVSVVTIEEELAFHRKLYAMTGNNTFKRFQVLLMPVFNHVFSEYYDKGIKIKIPKAVSHYDLLQILKSGTAEEFRKAMYMHLEPYFISSIAKLR